MERYITKWEIEERLRESEGLSNWEKLQRLFPDVSLRMKASIPDDEEPIVTRDPITDPELLEWAASEVLIKFALEGWLPEEMISIRCRGEATDVVTIVIGDD